MRSRSSIIFRAGIEPKRNDNKTVTGSGFELFLSNGYVPSTYFRLLGYMSFIYS